MIARGVPVRALMLLLSTLVLPTALYAVEEPDFAVVAATEAFEIRRYAPYIVAETDVDASFDGAGNRGFRVLASYIFGENTSRASIDMTAPVTQRASERIAMTAPVLQRADSGEASQRWIIGFVMPAEHTLESLPEPVNGEIMMREVPARLVAVRRYNGRWTEARFREHEQALREALAESAWRMVGDVEYARYDPPFKPWFLRRNEVMAEVVRAD